jgi:solute carrier family 25 (mitochondrial carnitine/acylcarnitine transporter), member 20/29
MITAVPIQNALLMGGYGIGKKWAEQHNQQQQQQQLANDTTTAQTTATTTTTTLLSVFVGGCTGGIIQSFLMSPVELIKVNQQVIGQSTRVAGREVVQGLWMFLRKNGTNKQTSSSSSSSSLSSWRGLNATLLRDGIPHGVWFASYEWCKTALAEYLECGADNNNNNNTNTGNTNNNNNKYHAQMTVPLVSGAFAATVAWVSVIRSWLKYDRSKPNKAPKIHSVWFLLLFFVVRSISHSVLIPCHTSSGMWCTHTHTHTHIFYFSIGGWIPI